MAAEVTMRELLVMRHAKSSWDSGAEEDRQRPLTDRGRSAAALLGRFLTASDHAPDLVLCSPAARARETAEIAAVGGEWECPLEFLEDFYGGDPESVIEALREVPEEQNRVLLVGHEPTWSQLVARLVGGGSVAMPTAAVACITLADSRWSDVAPGRGELAWLVPPRLLKGLRLL
jgi:phosphohistidine phosphatase